MAGLEGGCREKDRVIQLTRTSPGSLPLMDRFLRFSASGAQLCWRVKDGAKSVPVKTLETLPDGSELVMLHESDGGRPENRQPCLGVKDGVPGDPRDTVKVGLPET